MQTQQNKTILLIAYYFPPLGMGGVGRPYALFRYLPDNGYNVIVLTVKDILYPQYDYSLLNEDDEKMIYRCGSLDPARILYLTGFKKQSHSSFPNLSKRLPLYFPDLKRGWIYFAYKKLKKIINDNNISAVITTAPPPSVHLLGLKIKKNFDIPWVADFRDYWLPQPIEEVYPDGLMKNYSLKLKDNIMRMADEIISVNNDIKKYYDRGEVIMNGTDEKVVKQWQKSHDKNKEKDTLIIGALGTFNYLCPIEPLFESVRKLIDNNKIPGIKIKIIHAGFVDAEFNNMIKKYALDNVLIKMGYLERLKAIEALLPSDILYVSRSKFEEFNTLPGRIFDYLVSGKPVLGLVPENSDIADLLDEYPYGASITDYDTNKVIDYLRIAYEEKTSSTQSTLSFEYDTNKYTMSTLAKKYAVVLNRLVG